MPYPFTTAGGGITSVAWGDITGTLSDQTDLQAALDAKEDAAATTLDATDNTYWTGGVGGFPYSWSGTQWEGSSYDDQDPITRYIDRTGSWNDGYRPTSARFIFNSGTESEYPGDLDGVQMKVVIKDGFGSEIGSAPIVFTTWSEDVEVIINTLSFSGSGFGTDIDRLEVWSSLKNTAPIIKTIEFSGG